MGIMRVMKPLNTWLSLENGFVLDDNMAYLADILQAIPLTLALKALNPQFSVDLLHLGASAVAEDEQVYIPTAAGYSREVALCLQQETVVWARSVCSANDSAWHEIMDCGTLPLGMRLYELPLERTEFEYAYLSPEHPANPCNEVIVSRRSCFYLQAAPLLLIESYLPVLKHYDE